MANYGNLKTRTLNELLPNATSTAPLDTAVSNALLSAVTFYEPEPFQFNEADTSFLTISNIADYTPPVNLLVVESMTITRNSRRSPLYRKSLEWFDTRNTSSASGEPFAFVFVRNRFRLFPAPDATTMTVSLTYLSQLTTLPGSASGSTSNAWTNAASELIRTHAKVDVMESILRDYNGAQVMRAREQQILTRLQTRSWQQRFTGTNFLSHW